MKTNQWAIMAPYARLAFVGTQGSLRGLYAELKKVPGVKQRRGLWRVPYNALTVVERLRARHCVQLGAATWASPPAEVPPWEEIEAQLRSSGEVREWVLDGFLMPYQQEAIAFGWQRTGAHFWMPTGSGKTVVDLLCALSVPGPVLIITRAAVRTQLAREAERFLNVRAFVIRPASLKGNIRVKGETWNEFRSRHKGQGLSTRKMGKLWREHQARFGVDQPKQLEDYCREVEHRPIVVVAWEALASHIERLVKLRPGTVVFDEVDAGKGRKRWDVMTLSMPEDPEEVRQTLGAYEQEARAKGGFIKRIEEVPGQIEWKMFLPVLNTAAAAAKLARIAKKRLGSTATPIRDRVRDLWSQLDLVEPNAHGNASTWLNRYADRKPGIYGGYDTRGSSNLDELNERLATLAYVVHYEETHRHLPQKRRQSVYIAPEDQGRPTAGFPAELKAAKKRGANAVLEVRLAQSASKKLPAVLDMITDHIRSQHKVTVFTGRRRDCDLLGEKVRKAVAKTVPDCTVWSAHGGDSAERRQEIVDEYMAHPGPCVLVGTGHSFGTGLDIHDTDATFFVMLPYTPGQLRQWEGRFCRLGQKRPVIIYYVIAEATIDEHVASILIDKLPAVQDVVNDTELAAAGPILAGIEDETDEEFVKALLEDLDF